MPPFAARALAAIVLLLCVGFAAREIPAAVRSARGNFLAFSDFFAQWSFAHFAWANLADGVARIYDPDVLHRFQVGLEPALRQTFPFPYPPSYLFALWPLGDLPYGVGYFAWDAVTLTLFAWAVFGTRPRMVALCFVLLAPVTILTLIQGQNGLLTSALLVGGMRLLRDRPISAGVLFGLATIKPQLGVLLPFALIAAGRWRTVAAAGATAAGLVVASGLSFGWDVWPAWLHAASGHAAYLDRAVGNYLKPTIMANLMLFGVTPPVAHLAQAALAVAVATIVVLCFRQGVTDLSLAVLQIGTYLAVPYVFRYDMPMLVNAILLLAWDRRTFRPMGWFAAGVIALGLLTPALTTLTTRFFYVDGLSLLLLFGLATYWAWGPGHAVIAPITAEIVRGP